VTPYSIKRMVLVASFRHSVPCGIIVTDSNGVSNEPVLLPALLRLIDNMHSSRRLRLYVTCAYKSATGLNRQLYQLADDTTLPCVPRRVHIILNC